jgi:20S proteasome alpha/beta subunit
MDFLEKNYKENLSFDDALTLGIKAISLNLEPKQKLNPQGIEVINISDNGNTDAVVPLEKYSKQL